MSFTLRSSQVLRRSQLAHNRRCTRPLQWSVGSAMSGSRRNIMSDREEVFRSWTHSLQLSEQLHEEVGLAPGYVTPPLRNFQVDPERQNRIISLVSHREEVAKSWAHILQLSTHQQDPIFHEETMFSMDLKDKIADLEDNLETLTKARSVKPADREELVVSEAPQESATRGEQFQPTDDWQPVPQNTICPAGLHFRIDVTTGRKLVRLPQEKEKQI